MLLDYLWGGKRLKKLSWKFAVVCTTIMLVTTALLGFYAVNNMQELLTAIAKKTVKHDISFAQEHIDTKLPGAWQVKGDKLFKGNVLINDNASIVDEIKTTTENDVTIFLLDTRVATSVKDAQGKRAIGTKASNEVVERVLNNKAVFEGKASVVGVENEAIYKPIVDAQGQVVGILFMGTPTPFKTEIASFAKNISIFIVLAVLLAIGVIIFVSKKITATIEALVKSAELIAKGDLRVKVSSNSKDEVGQLAQAMQTMVGDIQKVIATIQHSSDLVENSSKQLSTNAMEAAEVSSQVANSICEVSSDAECQSSAISVVKEVVEQTALDIENTMDTANKARENANQATLNAKNGSQAIETVVKQMASINKTVLFSANAVNDLGERSQEIGKIVDTISSIASQTNLLALNAAIEAARAGEHGRGFAVVAEEVRKLAEQSALASKDIVDLINIIQRDTTQAVQAISAGKIEVETGSEVVNNAGKAFAEIYQQIQAVNNQTQEISTLVGNMFQGNSKILVAIEDINNSGKNVAEQSQNVSAATQELSATMEEIASSTDILAGLAVNLKSETSKFKI